MKLFNTTLEEEEEEEEEEENQKMEAAMGRQSDQDEKIVRYGKLEVPDMISKGW